MGCGSTFPAVFDAFGDLTACDTLELVGAAPDPDTAVGLSRAERIRTALRVEHLAQPGVLAAVYAATVRWVVAVLFVLSTEVGVLRGEVGVLRGRSRPILAGIRMLRSTARSLGSDRSSAPGCWVDSAATTVVTATRKHAGTMPGLLRSFASSGFPGSCWPATPATVVSPTLCNDGPSPR